MNDVEKARGELLETLRVLGIYITNMLAYARENFIASQPGNVRRVIRQLRRHSP